ncbi:MAG: type II toxin-antitoxin system PemK/MazF family toxin [Verrucomicrobia bacterium]|nr:type II toxin-antitoxin system PemK/MazF family toxin [Verrucomicrobiota bacterium]
MSRAKRGEIWNVNLEPTIGAEIAKVRLAAVMNVPNLGKLPLVLVVPVTDWKPSYLDYVWFVYWRPTIENGLKKPSGADAFQVKSISELRLPQRLGRVTETELNSMAAAVALCVGYQHPNTIDRTQ